MASSTFEMVVGPRGVFSARSGRTTTVQFSAGPLFSADPYGAAGFSRGASTVKAWLPPPREPVLNADGTMRPSWYRFFDHLANQRLGGISGPSLSEVEANVTETKAKAVNAIVTAAAVETMATTNAEALKAAVEVSRNAALPGASSIPPVALRSNSITYAEF